MDTQSFSLGTVHLCMPASPPTDCKVASVGKRFFWFNFLKQSLWLTRLLDDAELMRGFWAQLFGHSVFPYFCGAGEAGAAAGHGSGTAAAGCFRLPAPARSTGRRSWARCPGRSHRAMAA